MATPEFSTDELREAFEYLDELRESGRTNMFGAAAYMEREIGWPRHEAGEATRLWMQTFSAEPMQQRVTAALSGASA